MLAVMLARAPLLRRPALRQQRRIPPTQSKARVARKTCWTTTCLGKLLRGYPAFIFCVRYLDRIADAILRRQMVELLADVFDFIPTITSSGSVLNSAVHAHEVSPFLW